MVGVDVEGASVERCRTRYHGIVVIVLLVVLIPIGWIVFDWLARIALLRSMLGDGSYSLGNDSATISRVRAVVPQLIEIHQKAVVECGEAKMADLTRMEAFNRRIKSWHAIIMALEVASDSASFGYVKQFVNSERALPEEVTAGKNALSRLSEAREDEERGHDSY